MKKIMSLVLILALCLSFMLSGCASKASNGETSSTNNAASSTEDTASDQAETQTPAQTYEIKVAAWFDPGHPMIESLEYLKKNLEEKTNGGIKLSIFPSSQLGSEEVFIDSVKSGTVEMAVTGTMINTYAPLVAVAEKPFLFDSWAHAKKAYLENHIGDIMSEGIIQKAGFRVVGWSVNGWRMISTNKPVNCFEDLKGLKLRVPNVPYYIEMAKAWGCNPTPMAFSELFTALEQKVVDGQDNPYATVKASSFYEVQPYMVNSGHIFTPCPWVINEKFYQSLPAEYQKIYDTCIADAIAYNWKISEESEAETIQFLKDQGVTIVYPDEEFKQKLKDSQIPTNDWWYETYPGAEELEKKIEAMK